MKKIIILIAVILPFMGFGQQPKLNIKAFGGINTNSFIYQVEGESAETFGGWQTGAGLRVMYRRVFAEFDGVYLKYGTSLQLFEEDSIITDGNLDFRMRALEFPLTAGYIAVKKPFFKWFLYGGFVNKFSLNGKYKFLGEEVKFKPKEFDLHFYNLAARFGTQFDVAMFNIDLNYNIGITNGIKNKARTNTQGLQLTLGLLF